MKTRLIHEIGAKPMWGVMWYGGKCGFSTTTLHSTRCFGPVGPSDIDSPDLHNPPIAPVNCDHCGEKFPGYDHVDAEGRTPTKFSGTHRVYDTESGDPGPGDIYEMPWYHRDGKCFEGWENCDGRHFVCVLPDGHDWHMQGRASNCTMKEDKTHRCWVVHEEAPGVFHVDKGGNTCAAGAGSIMTGSWHGFLVHGELVQC